MAEIKVEPGRPGSTLPWIVGLAVAALLVGWLIWQNTQG